VTLFAYVLSAHEELLAWERELNDIAERLETAKEEERRRLIDRQFRLMEQFQREGGLTFRNRTRSALLGLGFTEEELNRPIVRFSGGQIAKGMLARAILRKADLLLLDEPTNNLDVAAICYLQEFLSSYKGAYVLVSHDRAFLDASVNRVLELENGHLNATRGNYTRHVELKMDEREIAARRYQQTMKEIRRIEGIIAQQRRWNQARNYVTIASKEKQIERLREGLVPPERDPASIHFHFRGAEPSGNEIIDVRDLAVAYGKKKVFRHADLLVWKGQTVCLVGANGCGKSSFLKVLAGQIPPDEGHFRLGAGVRLGYFQQNTDQLTPEHTILQEMQNAFPHALEGELRNYLGAFLFRGDDIYKRISTLSGGERARIKLLQLVLSGANVLLLDEPTNHFDIASCEVLEKALESFGGTILIVTHDRYLVQRIADRVVLLDENGFVEPEQDEGDIFERLMTRPQPKQEKQSPEVRSNYYLRQKERKAALIAARQEVVKAERSIEANEKDQGETEAAISQAEERGDFEQMQRLCVALGKLQEQESLLYEALERAENEKVRLEKEEEA
jgi:ATP-binding cassette subfamily F protein 3